MSGFKLGKLILRPRHAGALGILLLASLLACIRVDTANASSAAVDRAISEYEVKAAYVYNFAKFVDWPSTAFSAPNAPICVGVIGADDFAALLEKVVKDKLIQEHPIQVRLLKWPADLGACNIVYVGATEQKRFRQICESVQNSPVLTITEAEDKSQVKGIMNLFMESGKVQFEVNIEGAEKARLRISSKLLRLARGTVGRYSGKGE